MLPGCELKITKKMWQGQVLLLAHGEGLCVLAVAGAPQEPDHEGSGGAPEDDEPGEDAEPDGRWVPKPIKQNLLYRTRSTVDWF